MGGMKALVEANHQRWKSVIAKIAHKTATDADAKAETVNTAATTGNTVAQAANTTQTNINTAAKFANAGAAVAAAATIGLSILALGVAY